MTETERRRVFDLRHHNVGINEIARQLGCWPHSIRWVLRRGELLEEARVKRETAGSRAYLCGNCKQPGHNRISCGVKRP